MSHRLTAEDLAMAEAILLWHHAIELEVIVGCDNVEANPAACQEALDSPQARRITIDPSDVLACLAGLFDACDEGLDWEECIQRAGSLVLGVQTARAEL